MKWIFLSIMMAMLAGCAAYQPASRIALIAPFEGRYREVGYNALYAARLALADAQGGMQLLALDDGGSEASAAQRLSAVVRDRSVAAAIVLGPFATAPQAQSALAGLPTIIIGAWTDSPPAASVFTAASSQTATLITLPFAVPLTTAAAYPDPLIVHEIGGLENFQTLRQMHERSAILVTSGHPASASFVQRYLASAQYAPRPNHLAELTYDLTAWLALLCDRTDCARETISARLAADSFTSAYNGVIAFGADSFWSDAPLNAFRIESGALSPVSLDDVINER